MALACKPGCQDSLVALLKAVNKSPACLFIANQFSIIVVSLVTKDFRYMALVTPLSLLLEESTYFCIISQRLSRLDELPAASATLTFRS